MILKSMKERSCFSRPFDGKRIMGKASFAELKDAEGRIQVYFMIFRLMRKKQCTMWFQNYWILAILLVRGTVSKRKWEKSQFMFMD
jgi:lysyl-tRNA synthetase class II